MRPAAAWCNSHHHPGSSSSSQPWPWRTRDERLRLGRVRCQRLGRAAGGPAARLWGRHEGRRVDLKSAAGLPIIHPSRGVAKGRRRLQPGVALGPPAWMGDWKWGAQRARRRGAEGPGGCWLVWPLCGLIANDGRQQQRDGPGGWGGRTPLGVPQGTWESWAGVRRLGDKKVCPALAQSASEKEDSFHPQAGSRLGSKWAVSWLRCSVAAFVCARVSRHGLIDWLHATHVRTARAHSHPRQYFSATPGGTAHDPWKPTRNLDQLPLVLNQSSGASGPRQQQQYITHLTPDNRRTCPRLNSEHPATWGSPR